jgi:hypothetical protein
MILIFSMRCVRAVFLFLSKKEILKKIYTTTTTCTSIFAKTNSLTKYHQITKKSPFDRHTKYRSKRRNKSSKKTETTLLHHFFLVSQRSGTLPPIHPDDKQEGEQSNKSFLDRQRKQEVGTALNCCRHLPVTTNNESS